MSISASAFLKDPIEREIWTAGYVAAITKGRSAVQSGNDGDNAVNEYRRRTDPDFKPDVKLQFWIDDVRYYYPYIDEMPLITTLDLLRIAAIPLNIALYNSQGFGPYSSATYLDLLNDNKFYTSPANARGSNQLSK